MSEGDNLIEELKRSLKITENEYLESEIEDLREFFTVQTTYEADCLITENDKKCFWLEVFLPVTLRKITKEGKEILSNEKPLISFKIKLKNGECLPVEVTEAEDEEKQDEQEEAATATAVEVTDTNETDLAEEEKATVIKCINDAYEKITDKFVFIEDDVVITEASATSATNVTENFIKSGAVDESLPYEIIEVKISELNESISSSSTTKLSEIFESLIHPSDISLLNVIEEFYIKLEEKNYPNKMVICRDYYYPVFDCRHWGRSQSSSSNKSQTPTDNSSSSSISYRARALYDFQALMQGELSFQENEMLIVLANLGNGWLTARRTSTSSNSINEASDDTTTGIIPENYIERL